MIRPKPIFGWTLLDDLAPTPSSWLPQTESRFLGPRGWGTPLSCPFLQPGSCRFRWGQTPALARSVPGRLALSFQPRGQGPQRWWWHCPLSDAGHHPQVPSGWGPVGGELPSATLASDWLWSAAVPATRLPLPGWRSHIGSDGKCSSEFWAQLRLTEACQPHQKPDTPALCPRPLPTRPPAQPGRTVTPATAPSGCQAQSTQPPCPPGLCPLGQAHSGAQAPAQGHSRPSEGLLQRGEAARKGGGEGGS